VRGRANPWLVVAVLICAVAAAAAFWSAGDRDAGRAVQPDTGPEIPHVLVLNGTGRAGLAREISLLLGPAGCVAAGVGNAPEGFAAASMLVDRRLSGERARRLADLLGGVPVLREWDGRASEDAVLVLGDDWSRVRDALAAAGRDGGRTKK
jgi:hypothetical protein